jgi:hypothetical protein
MLIKLLAGPLVLLGISTSPAAAFDPDIHYIMTFVPASANGFSWKHARAAIKA